MKLSVNATSRSGCQAILLAALLTGFIGTASATSRIYLKLEDTEIASDGLPEAWKGWIASRSFGKGFRCLPADDTASPVQPVPVPQLSRTFQVVRPVDKASPLLAQAAIDGQVFPTLTAVYLREGETPGEGVRITLENVSIVSVRVSGSTLEPAEPAAAPGGGPMEEVAFAFDGAVFYYSGNDDKPQPEPPVVPPNETPQDEFADLDKDGLPDSYEKAHGLDLNANDADADLDKDGLTNREEFAAGSLPNDRRSRFGIDSIKLLSGKPGRGVVSFRTLPGRHYRLLGSPTGQKWFELTSLTTPDADEVAQQEIELPFNGLTQLLRIEVSMNP